LRRKIGDDPADPAVIQTVLRGGYRLGLGQDS
jgi:DNA-binding response OmpR family regulator